jgi:hypothetical protein
MFMSLSLMILPLTKALATAINSSSEICIACIFTNSMASFRFCCVALKNDLSI